MGTTIERSDGWDERGLRGVVTHEGDLYRLSSAKCKTREQAKRVCDAACHSPRLETVSQTPTNSMETNRLLPKIRRYKTAGSISFPQSSKACAGPVYTSYALSSALDRSYKRMGREKDRGEGKKGLTVESGCSSQRVTVLPAISVARMI